MDEGGERRVVCEGGKSCPIDCEISVHVMESRSVCVDVCM